jgi:hypothetical protein
MLSDLKALLRSASPAFSGSSTTNNSSVTLPSASPVSISDQYPFPTDPSRVRKARHNNHPRYLPQRDASIKDVQYFLYTLLTSRKHDCARKYPEWVLETCMGWTGNGEELRTRTEEQLVSLCPITAVAKGIQSPKHKPGDYVPVPARSMIGEVIAGYVRKKKALENQPGDVHQSLYEETMRASSAMGRYRFQGAMRDQDSTRPPSIPRSLSKARAFNLPDGHDIQYVSDFSPSSWMAPGMGTNNNHITGPMTVPAHMYDGSYMSGGRYVPPHGSDMRSSVSSLGSVVTQNTTDSSFSQPQANVIRNGTDTSWNEQQLYWRQRRKMSHEAREAPTNSGRSSPSNSARLAAASTSQPQRPHRYASCRESPLRNSSTPCNDPNTISSSTMTSGHDATIRMVEQDNRPPVGRRSSLTLIPGTLTEGHESSECDGDDDLEKIRHDSGVESSSNGEQSFSTTSPALLDYTSIETPETTLSTPVNGFQLSRASSAGPSLHQSRSMMLSSHTLPTAKQVTRPASVNSNRNTKDLPRPTGSTSSVPRESPELVETVPLQNNDEYSTRPGHDFVIRSERLKQMEADYQLKQKNGQYEREEMEANYQRLKNEHERPRRQFHNLSGQSLRHSQSARTLHSSCNPRSEPGASHTRPFVQSRPPSTPPLGRPSTPQGPNRHRYLPEKTLMQEIDNWRERAPASVKAQETARKRHEAEVGR